MESKNEFTKKLQTNPRLINMNSTKSGVFSGATEGLAVPVQCVASEYLLIVNKYCEKYRSMMSQWKKSGM